MNRPSYELRLEARGANDRSTYRFGTADGVASKRSFRDAELLLANRLWETDLDRLLCPAANYGVVGTCLAPAADAVRMTEASARAAALCRRNVGHNGIDAAVSIAADVTTLEERFETVAYAPKAYAPLEIGSQYVADALAALRPGGSLYLAASKRSGLGRYEDHLEDLAASVERLGSRGDVDLLRAIRPSSFDPPSFVTPREIRASIGDVELSLYTVPGLFAASGLDAGTRLLLETVGADLEDGRRVLDCCCGYGPVGAYAASIANCDVWLTDDCRFATACAERSLEATGVEGTVVTADCLEGVSDRTFDTVLCNPPTHAGDGILSELFAGVADVLAPDGSVSFVHHRDLDLEEHLERFDRVETRETGAEHVVVTARP